jgi:hypothetical protein
VGDSGSLAAIPWISWDHARSVLVVQGGECPESSMDGHALPASRVRRIRLLRTVPHPDLGRPLPDHDVICLTRPEDVSVYWDVYGRGAFCGEVWCTGERTRAALHDLGLRAEVVIGDVPRGMAWPRSSPVPAAHSAVPALAEIPMARDGAGN